MPRDSRGRDQFSLARGNKTRKEGAAATGQSNSCARGVSWARLSQLFGTWPPPSAKSPNWVNKDVYVFFLF